MIKYEVFTKKKLPKELAKIYQDHFNLPSDISGDVKHFINSIKPDCSFVVEYPYVDKVFRDSFYTYFSSKLNNYPRNCIRVSVFYTKIDVSEFTEADKHEELKETYGGFFVVRPTYPNPIGRTILSKKFLAKDDFLSCTTTFPITSSGLKLLVEGFPYSSQDQETISCAETTLWGIMEYFSNRYAKYSPALPSDIISTLQDIRSERQLPSRGLNVNDLSHALKKFGFGTRIYDRKQFGPLFESLLSCYVESGIPIIIALSDGKSFHHAVTCMGREKVEESHIKQLKGTSGLRDFDDIRKKFVFMDDNLPPYQRAYLDTPASNYPDPSLHSTVITHFIVPLYPKIYLEAFEAKLFCLNFLTEIGLNDAIFRILLTSSRSYKNEIIENPKLSTEYKEQIISVPMPKFIWLCEITDEQNILSRECYGSIVLDATEPNINQYKPLIFIHLGDSILRKDKGLLSSHSLANSITSCNVFKSNLSGF